MPLPPTVPTSKLTSRRPPWSSSRNYRGNASIPPPWLPWRLFTSGAKSAFSGHPCRFLFRRHRTQLRYPLLQTPEFRRTQPLPLSSKAHASSGKHRAPIAGLQGSLLRPGGWHAQSNFTFSRAADRKQLLSIVASPRRFSFSIFPLGTNAKQPPHDKSLNLGVINPSSGPVTGKSTKEQRIRLRGQFLCWRAVHAFLPTCPAG